MLQKEYLYFIKHKLKFVSSYHEELIFGMQLSHVDLKTAVMYHSLIQTKINFIFSHKTLLISTLRKLSPESNRVIARNTNIGLQSTCMYSKSDVQHHIRSQQFQELLFEMDTIQRQSIDQNLKKLKVETT